MKCPIDDTDLAMADRQGIAADLVAQLEARGGACVLVEPGAAFESRSPQRW